MDATYTVECLRAAISAIQNGDSNTALHNIEAAKDDILALDNNGEEFDKEFDGEPNYFDDQFANDMEADADVLRSAGMGTDEDYGFFGYPDE